MKTDLDKNHPFKEDAHGRNGHSHASESKERLYFCKNFRTDDFYLNLFLPQDNLGNIVLDKFIMNLV